MGFLLLGWGVYAMARKLEREGDDGRRPLRPRATLRGGRWWIKIYACHRWTDAVVELGTVSVSSYGEHIAVGRQQLSKMGYRSADWSIGGVVETHGSMPSEAMLIASIATANGK